MERDYVKRFVKKDGSERITFYRDDYADSPRDMTDEPLHCEDWSRDYSIMNKKERETRSGNAANFIRYMLQRYGNNKEIIKLLKDNYKSDSHSAYDNGLAYDRSRKEWVVYSWQPSWKDYSGEVHEAHWCEEWSFCVNIYNVDIYNIADVLSDEQIDILCNPKYWTDGIKMMSYNFGYYGGISFDDEFSTDSEGICWLEKDEFLKYSGNSEDYWNSKSLKEIEFLLDEISAWSSGDVYGFMVEKCVKSIVNKTYVNVDKDDEEYDEVEWVDEDGCCFGFYGEFDKVEGWMLDEAGFKKEELEEESL